MDKRPKLHWDAMCHVSTCDTGLSYLLCRVTGWGHRRDEHHADIRDRAHTGNWHTQGHRRPPRRHTFAVSTGSRGTNPGRWYSRHLNRVVHLHTSAHFPAFASLTAVLYLATNRF